MEAIKHNMVLVQKSHKVKKHSNFQRISSYDTHHFIKELHFRKSTLNFFNLPFPDHV